MGSSNFLVLMVMKFFSLKDDAGTLTISVVSMVVTEAVALFEVEHDESSEVTPRQQAQALSVPACIKNSLRVEFMNK